MVKISKVGKKQGTLTWHVLQNPGMTSYELAAKLKKPHEEHVIRTLQTILRKQGFNLPRHNKVSLLDEKTLEPIRTRDKIRKHLFKPRLERSDSIGERLGVGPRYISVIRSKMRKQGIELPLLARKPSQKVIKIQELLDKKFRPREIAQRLHIPVTVIYRVKSYYQSNQKRI